MSNLPDKLIAVGMRYIAGVPKIVSQLNLPQKVHLRCELNDKASNDLALEVILLGLGTKSPIKIGYIREADLVHFPSRISGAVYDDYEITTVSSNYLVLRNSNRIICDPNAKISAAYNPCTEVPTDIKQKEQTKMNNMRDSFFREIKNAVLDVTTGGFGILTSEGISTYKDGQVSVNPIQEMGIQVPAFAVRVAVDTLAEGDIIINGNEVTFYKGKTDTAYEVVSTSGEVKTMGSISNMFFGKNTVLAVKNMVAGSGMNPMMMAMLMGDGKNFDMKTLALMSMMGGNTGMDSNMLMMMAMMGK